MCRCDGSADCGCCIINAEQGAENQSRFYSGRGHEHLHGWSQSQNKAWPRVQTVSACKLAGNTISTYIYIYVCVFDHVSQFV